MYKTRNRKCAIFNMMTTLYILFVLFIKLTHPGLQMLYLGIVILIGPIILTLFAGIANINVGITNNKEDKTNKYLFLCVGIIDLAMVSLEVFQSVIVNLNITKYLILFEITINFVLSVILLVTNLNFKDTNYEFKDKKSTYIFVLAVILYSICVVISITNLFRLSTTFKKLVISKTPVYHLVLNNKDDKKIYFYTQSMKQELNYECEEVSSQITSNLKGKTDEIISYCLIKNKNTLTLVDLVNDEPKEVEQFKITKAFNMKGFRVIETLTNSERMTIQNTTMENKKNTPKDSFIEMVQDNVTDYSKYEDKPNLNNKDFDYYDDEDSEENYVDYKYFNIDYKNGNDRYILQVIYLPEKKEEDKINKFLVNKNRDGIKDFYEYEKEYYLINLYDDKKYRLKGVDLIFGNLIKRSSTYLDSILLYLDYKIPYVSENECGYFSLDKLEQVILPKNLVAIIPDDEIVLCYNVSDNCFEFYDLNQKNTINTIDKAFNQLYEFNSLKIFKKNKENKYIVYSKKGIQLDEYDNIYCFGSEFLIGAKNENDVIIYDVYNRDVKLNKNNLTSLQIWLFDSIENYKYKSVFDKYIN